MKLCSPSNGCETRPVKGDPPTPVASLAASAVTKTPMRRHASEWAVGVTATKERAFGVPRALCSLKAMAVSTRWASRDAHPAGSEPTARWKRTAQAPGRPFFLRVARGTGSATGQGRPEPRPTGGRESEGCIRARTSGNGLAPRTRPSKGGPWWCELSKGPMTGALTSGLMSPEIRKVVDRARKWLRRRSNRTRLTWPRFVALLERYPLPVPRIRVRIWGASP